MTDRSPGTGGPDAPRARRGLLAAFLVVAGAACGVRLLGLGRTSTGVAILVTLQLALPFLLAGAAMLRVEPRRLGRGLGDGLLAAAVLIPPFLFAVLLLGRLSLGGLSLPMLAREVPFQIFAVAVPEEFFFRGFLQRAFERGRRKVRILGAECGLGLVAASVLFALAHLAMQLDPAALLVFFPSLAFGWLYARRGSIAGGAIFHAACNLSLLLCPGLFG